MNPAYTALGVLLFVAASAPAAPVVPDFEIIAGNRRVLLHDVRGDWAAVHYLPGLDDSAVYLNELSRRCDLLAGVTHFVLVAASPAAVENFTMRQVEGSSLLMRSDADGAIARSLNLFADSVLRAAVLIVDPAGEEVFRRVAASREEYPSLEELFSRLDRLTASSEVAVYNLGSESVAIKGYDPVAYFDSATAVPGRSDLTCRYRGVDYRFSSAGNRHRFAREPRKFFPTYGGWCATAMAEGKKVDIDPTNFKITDGRLFLFYKGWLGNARRDWDRNEAELTRRADDHWARLTASSPPAREQ